MKNVKIIVAAVAFIVCGIIFSCSRSDEVTDLSQMLTETIEDSSGSTEPGGYDETERASCFVYVCGAVVSPGVIELDEGSRVVDAIDAAGGVTEDAAPEYLNLAESVFDGEKIYVPTADEMKAEITAGQENAKININTATAEQLKTLSGIGDKKAADIINYRESHGSFTSIEDIMKVPGIKNAAFEKIKENITV